MADVANRIITSSQLPNSIALDVISDFAQDPQGLINEDTASILQGMEGLGVQFADCEDDLIGNEERKRLQADWDAKKADFFMGIGVRLARE